MLQSVDFVPRATVEALKPAPDMVVISVNNPGDTPPASVSEFAQGLTLFFLDIEPDANDGELPCFFSQQDADTLVAFIRALHADPRAYRLVVHCQLGASRSAAIALIAHAASGCAFPRQQHAGYANRHVAALGSLALGLPVTIPPKLVVGHDWVVLPRHVLI